MYCLMMGRFSSVGAHGRTGRSDGGRARRGQEHGWSVGVGTPVLVHGGKEARTAAVTAAGSVAAGGGQEPIEGKLAGMVCNWTQHSLER